MLFYTSSIGLLTTSLVAVLAVASPSLRAASFVLFAIFCNGVPFLYQLTAKYGGKYADDAYVAHASDVPARYVCLWAASLSTFVLGLCFKTSYLPERLYQTRFTDLFFASHQLWHLCINVAFVLGTFLAWDSYLSWRAEHACPVEAAAVGT